MGEIVVGVRFQSRACDVYDDHFFHDICTPRTVGQGPPYLCRAINYGHEHPHLHKEHFMAFTTTASGLQFEDTVVGSGVEAKPGSNVTVHYTGWLYENGAQGAKFDSSKDRDEPFIFPLGGGMVIKGWDEGVQGMKVGGQRTLIIPASLGYGARGAGGVIPPNATLKFDVELLGT